MELKSSLKMIRYRGFDKRLLALLALFIVGSTALTRLPCESVSSFQFDGHVVWAQTTADLFTNATSPADFLGNRSIIPGIHAMSLANEIKPTWLIISSDNELSVNIRYEGTNVTAPAVSLLATALKPSGTILSQLVSSFERVTGTNVTQAGWISPLTVPIQVQGNLSLYDADLIVVMIVPYTGPPISMNSSATNTYVIPQGQS